MPPINIRLLNARYGLQTLFRAGAPRIFVNSIPKSGTNLAVSLAMAFGRMHVSGPVISDRVSSDLFARRRGLIFGHVENATATTAGLGLDAQFLLVRAPVDYARSLVRYIESNSRHPAHRLFANETPEVIFRAVIEGFSTDRFKLPSVADRYRGYIAAAQQAGAGIIDFSDLSAGAPNGGAAEEFLNIIGGENWRDRLQTALERSKETSTTFKHSQRSTFGRDFGSDLRAHPLLSEAEAIYENALCRRT